MSFVNWLGARPCGCPGCPCGGHTWRMRLATCLRVALAEIRRVEQGDAQHANGGGVSR